MNFFVSTKGHYDFVDITAQVKEIVEKSSLKEGMVLVFVKGSTAAITILEHEEGLIEDIKEVWEKLAPEAADYKHHQKWGDHNGAAHIKSSFLKPDLLLPLTKGELDLGTWQQIFLIDFDEKPRQREIVVKIVSS